MKIIHMKNHCCSAIAALGLALIAMPSTAGEYYKWVDENGVSHFSERPPKEATAEKVKTSARPPTTEEVDAAESAEQEALVDEPKAKIGQDPARCTAEQNRLKQLSSGARIRMQNPDGGFYYLDERQIQQEMQKSRQAISESCE
ncbi:MAG TPA: DUF4124 domain-containing protein [Marinagarivorans sp.]